VSRPAMEPTQSPIQWAQGPHFPHMVRAVDK